MPCYPARLSLQWNNSHLVLSHCDLSPCFDYFQLVLTENILLETQLGLLSMLTLQML